jgi:small-conductance mechanosensitive channel
VVGIAFLAQWSIISNITSTLIIFFNHQVNIGDTIVILDKDYNVEGKISDIGIFFIVIKVNDNEYVSLPSNVFMQKMIKKIKSPTKES